MICCQRQLRFLGKDIFVLTHVQRMILAAEETSVVDFPVPCLDLKRLVQNILLTSQITLA